MLSLISSPESRISKNIILCLAFRKQAFRKCNPWDCLLVVGYAYLFIESLSADRVGRIAYAQLNATNGGERCPVFVPFGDAYGAYSIHSYDWVRVILRNTDAIPQLGTCCLSKKCLVFVPFGDACGAYAIRPYNRVRAILRNTDAILQLGTCGPSKNDSVFVPYGAVCGAYAIRPYDRVRAALQKTIPFSSPLGPSVGRMQYAPTIGYVRSFEILMQFLN